MTDTTEEARILLAEMTAEFGKYPDWDVTIVETFITKHQLSKEEIIAEYRERMEMLEVNQRRKAKELIAGLRTRYGSADGLTEKKILRWIRDGFEEPFIARIYETNVASQRGT